MSGKPVKGIFLLAFGGADSIESVEPFVKNVLKGRIPTPELIEKARERYRLIGGKSPLLEITEAQGKAIAAVLNADPEARYEYRPFVGMRYWHPFIAETAGKMMAEGVSEAVAVIMSPILSLVATGAYIEDLEAAVGLHGGPAVDMLGSWHMERPFRDLVADNIEKELSGIDRKDALIIFSSHSLPAVSLEGDPYEMIVKQASDFVMEKVGKADFRVAFQSKGAGARQWLGPETESVIEEAAKKGKKRVIVVPIGFAADHVETLYDIDILFKGIAAEKGLEFRRTPSLNTDPRFMGLLASMIKKVAEKKQ
jgi:ferrochelatase